MRPGACPFRKSSRNLVPPRTTVSGDEQPHATCSISIRNSTSGDGSPRGSSTALDHTLSRTLEFLESISGARWLPNRDPHDRAMKPSRGLVVACNWVARNWNYVDNKRLVGFVSQDQLIFGSLPSKANQRTSQTLF